MSPKIFESKLFMAGLIVLLVLSVLGLWSQVTGTIKIRKEINRLEQQARELQSKNSELQELADYLNSPAYQEKVAREQLNLQTPGEIAVALPGAPEEQTVALETQLSNFARWRHYFFAPR